MAEGTKRLRLLNVVQNDEIWKDHVRLESYSARHKWPETWSFLLKEYRKFHGACKQQLVDEDRESPVSFRPSIPKLPKIPTRTPGFPYTTTQQIGWTPKQVDGSCELIRKLEPRSHGQYTLYKQFKWSADSLP